MYDRIWKATRPQITRANFRWHEIHDCTYVTWEEAVLSKEDAKVLIEKLIRNFPGIATWQQLMEQKL